MPLLHALGATPPTGESPVSVRPEVAQTGLDLGWPVWVAGALFLLTAVISYAHLSTMTRASVSEKTDADQMRLLSGRMLRSIGLWQWSVVLVLLALDTDVSGVIALVGVGTGMIAVGEAKAPTRMSSWLARRWRPARVAMFVLRG